MLVLGEDIEIKTTELFIFNDEKGEAIIRIQTDGKVIIRGDIEKAAQAFWDRVRELGAAYGWKMEEKV